MAQYAFEYVITNLEKKCCFLSGLHTKIKVKMVGNFSRSYDEFVSISIKADESNCLHQEDKKRKSMPIESSSSNFSGHKMIVKIVRRLSCSPLQSQAMDGHLSDQLLLLPMQNSRILLVFVPKRCVIIDPLISRIELS